MDDKINQPQNQSTDVSAEPTPETIAEPPVEPKPIFETVTVEENKSQASENITPEELPPDITTPNTGEIGTEPPQVPPETPPIYEENKNKYLFIVGGVVLIIFFLFIFIKLLGSGGKKTSKQIKLTYWGLWEEKETFLPLIQAYQQQNPNIAIDYQKMSPEDYREKLITRGKNGQGPDLFRFHNTWLAELKEIVAPLPSSIMSNSEFEKTFYKIHQTDLRVGKYYYGLPLEIDGLVMICNLSLLNQAGITIPPTTWEEVIDATTKITVKDRSGNLITAGVALGTTSNIEHFSDIFGLMLAQNGADLKKLDQPEAAGALESYRKFAESPQGFWDDSMPNSLAAFIEGKVAMIIAPSWQVLAIKNSNPDINIKVVPVPYVPGGKPLSLANYWIEGVSRFSANQEEAWKFLRFLTEKENMTKLFEYESKTRLFGEPYSRIDLAPLLVQNQYLDPVIKQADNYISLPLVTRTFDNGMNDEIIKYLENAINSTAQGVSYGEALKTAKQGVDQVFSKFQIQ